MDDQNQQPTQAPGWTPPAQQDPQAPAEPVVNPTIPEPVVPPVPGVTPEPVVPTEPVVPPVAEPVV